MNARARRPACLCLAFLIVACGGPAQERAEGTPVTPAPQPKLLAAVAGTSSDGEAFSKRRAMRHVRRLAGRIGPRRTGTAGYRRGVRYVLGELRDLGFEVERMKFRLPSGVRSSNVIAAWPEADAASRLILGAHLDTVAGSPGANDNASGVATLLELARLVAGSEVSSSITFVAFGAEERQPDGGHHYGSAAYVEAMSRAERDEVRAMVSADMIGKVRRLTVGWMGQGDRGAVRKLLRAARRAGVPARARVLPDWSDNGPFERAGMPAALLWTGFEPNYHSPRDRPRNVKPRALRRAGRVLRALIRAVA